ncbi:sigma-70 family RNA polymerase sigma factor [Tundrisphaera sp. TA3]|uniref:sigma-70 family RNA polymerase sigma factor n=1 Tax=Tundrisphaera sp. TA3 TaxID=3435775 RepID=UPI003EBBE94C
MSRSDRGNRWPSKCQDASIPGDEEAGGAAARPRRSPPRNFPEKIGTVLPPQYTTVDDQASGGDEVQTNRRQGGPALLGMVLERGTLAGLSEVDLLRRFTDGAGADAELAFESLVRLHGPMVMRVCRSILADHHDAQDAYQATFLILARRAGSIRKAGSLAPWLHGVALRVSRAARADSARRRAHERRAASLVPDSVEGDPDQESAALVHEGLGRLPDRYRTPMILCDLEGLTHDAVAARLGWPVGTVKSRLSRGRLRLRGYLARRGLAPGGQSSAWLLAAGGGAGAPVAAASSYSPASLFGSSTSAEVPVRVALLMRKALRDMAVPKLAILSGLILAGGLATRGAIYAGPMPGAGPLPEDPSAASPLEPDPSLSKDLAGGTSEGVLPPALARPRPLETAVRLNIQRDVRQMKVVIASGVIVRSDAETALIVTAAHCFRDFETVADGVPRAIRVERLQGTFAGKTLDEVQSSVIHDGELVGIRREDDVALVRIRPGRPLPASPVAGAENPVVIGQELISVGCSEGRDASAWSTTVLDPISRLANDGGLMEAIECRFASKLGRSGGGLFSLDNELVGMSCYADPMRDRGLYASAASIRRLIAEYDEGLRMPPDGGIGRDSRQEGIVRPELAVKLTGHDVLHPGQREEYRLSIANTGQAAAKGVNIRINLPKRGGRLIRINDSSVTFEKRSRQLSWKLDQLDPGRSSEVSFVYLMGDPGLYRATAEATAGDVRAVASHQTDVVSGGARLNLDAFPSAPTIGVGGTHSYHITVTNVGGKDVGRVILRGKLSKNLRIVRHRGGVGDAFRFDDETGEFILAQIDRLPIGQDVRLGLDLQGVEAGPGSCRLALIPLFESDDAARADAVIPTEVGGGQPSPR